VGEGVQTGEAQAEEAVVNKVAKNSEKAARRWQTKYDAEKERAQKNKAGWAKSIRILNAIHDAFGEDRGSDETELPKMVTELRDALKVRSDALEAALDTEKKLKEGYLRSMGPSPDGKAFTIEFENSLAPIIAQHLLGILDGKNAPNYVEVVCMPKDGRRVAINIQRCAGKTPHDLRLEADAKVAKAMEVLKRLKAHYRSLNSGDLKIIEKTLAEIETKP
jgi:hypothetical protein